MLTSHPNHHPLVHLVEKINVRLCHQIVPRPHVTVLYDGGHGGSTGGEAPVPVVHDGHAVVGRGEHVTDGALGV